MANKVNKKQIAEENENLIKGNIFTNKPISVKYNLFVKLDLFAKLSINENGKIIMFDGYTDDAIIHFSQFNKKICSLNFANAQHPGGGYLRGAIAQEEDLCRQYPSLYFTLEEAKQKYKMYPLGFGELIYSSHVARYRENETKNYQIQFNPTIYTNFITCASPNLNGRMFSQISQAEREHIYKSIDLMFRVAINNEVKFLILGAWGCGAFAPNDNIYPTYEYTKFMATTFKIIANKYINNFSAIIFAIPKNDQNGIVFSDVFK